MFCAQCGQSVGARDRVCGGCSHDLLRSGAVRLTADIPGPGQARPLPPDLWRRRPATSTAVLPSRAGHHDADADPTLFIQPIRQDAPAAPISPISAVRRQPSVAARPAPQLDPASSPTPVRIPSAVLVEPQQRRGLSGGAKVAIGLLVLLIAAVAFPLTIIKLGLVSVPEINLSGTPAPATAPATQVPASKAPATTAPATTQAPATSAPTSPAPATKAVTFPAGATLCRPTVAAGANTSCGFALAVAAKVDPKRTEPFNVSAVSPVTKRAYAMSCARADELISCRGGDNASVYIAGS